MVRISGKRRRGGLWALWMWLWMGATGAWGQGIELHRVFGKALFPKAGRPEWTVTASQMGALRWGLIGGRVDMHVGNKGVTGAYGEFRYEWRTKWDGWAVLTEYDGGIDRGTAYGEAILGGMCYRWDSPDFTRGYSLSVVYKYIPDNKAHHNFQVGGTWDFGMGKVVETRGFAKIWREYLGENGGEYHVWMEPQVWWNVGSMKQGTFGESNLSLGSEVAIRYSFGIAPSFYAIPSVAIRFTF